MARRAHRPLMVVPPRLHNPAYQGTILDSHTSGCKALIDWPTIFHRGAKRWPKYLPRLGDNDRQESPWQKQHRR